MADECSGADLINIKHRIMSTTDIGFLRHIRELYEHRYDPEHWREIADLYWHTLLVLALVVIVGVSLYCTATFLQVLSIIDVPVAQAAPNKSSGGLDVTTLDATLKGFVARKTYFENLQKTAIPQLADPSK